MKNIIILGGNSKNNIKWVKDMKNQYKNNYNVKVIEYEHWSNDNDIDITKEVEKLILTTKSYQEYIIIAKSIGIWITILALKRKLITPAKIVFMGLPYLAFQKDNIDIIKEISSLSRNFEILIIQQEHDPLGSFKEIKQDLSFVELKCVPGDDHSYKDILNIKKLVDDFINI